MALFCLDNGAQSSEHNEIPPPTSPSPDITNDEIAPSVPESTPLPEPDLDPELLKALGDANDDVPAYGPNIHTSLAKRWDPILKKGLQQEAKEKLLAEYAVPENCKLLKAPTLNVEIYAAVSDLVRNRDKKLQTNQDQLGLGITAISKAMTLLLNSDDKIQSVKILTDACRILADQHYTQTQIRTKLITPGLEKSFLSVIKDEDRDQTLFGSKLSEKIKTSRAIEKQGLQIKKTQAPKPSTSAPATPSPARNRYQGNWSAPPRYPSSNRGGRTPYRTPTTSRPLPYRRAPATTSSSTRPSTTGANKRA
ncbi:hypothetical protein ABMA27_002301 [Loxostege sticticalis]|uniref:Gag protein n=1 Tax=Loxostege sticticalis TaxID=481309 RepID=A0ABR3HXA8_LOXSC